MKKSLFLLPVVFLLTNLSFGQTTSICFPPAGDYNTGSTNGYEFTETSIIKTQSALVEAGWARFDISGIPFGTSIQWVELNLYVAEDNYAYWQAVAIGSDPLTTSASVLFNEITSGGGSTFYAQWSDADFQDPDWWIADLGPDAATDLQEKLNNGEDWFGVGIWEYEYYGSYAIVCNGWNEAHPPFIVVGYFVPGAPLPAYNPDPPDDGINIELDIDLTWNFGDNTELYDLYFGTDIPPTNKVVENAPSGIVGTYSPGMLDLQTTYYWQVVSKNSTADLETPGQIWNFTTKCGDVMSPPIFENFEVVIPPEIPYCWFKIVNSSSESAIVQTSSVGGIDDSKSITIENAEDIDAELIFASPRLEGGVTGKYVNFFAKGYAPLIVGTLSDPTDANTFTAYSELLLLTWDYQEFEFFFTNYSSTDEYIAFKHGSNNIYQYLNIDNILIEEAPACPKPTELYLQSSTLTTATVGWIENGSAAIWELEYGIKGFTPTGIPMLSTDQNPVEIFGLDPGMAYDFYVRADCGGGEVSYWAGPFEFSTHCEPFDLPFIEDFESINMPELPQCWSKIQNTWSPGATVQTLEWGGLNNSKCIYMINGNDPEAVLMIISPQIQGGVAGKYLQFYCISGFINLSVGTMTDPIDATTYSEFISIPVSPNFDEHEVYFNSYMGTDEYIAFKYPSEVLDEQMTFDNILIDFAPACPDPSDLYFISSTINTATVGWYENGIADTWNLMYGFQGFTPPGVTMMTTGQNPAVITDLESGASYEFYVQAFCGAGYLSEWVGPFQFNTQCEPFDIPVLEDFDLLPSWELPVCWTTIEESTSYSFIEIQGYGGYSDPNCLRMYSANDPDPTLLFISPKLNDPINELWLTFFAWSYSSQIAVGTISDTSDASTYTEFANFSLSSGYQEFQVSFETYTGTDEYIAFKGLFQGTYKAICVDDIIIDDHLQTCPKPTELYGNNPTTNSIVLGWQENGDATQWNIEYGEASFMQTGIPNAVAYSNPFVLAGLTEGTQYKYYVQANCGTDENSYWEGPYFFHTSCFPILLPYTEDFEDIFMPFPPPCTHVENTNNDNMYWESSMVNPNNGLFHLSIQWNGSVPMDDWFFSAPLELLGGLTYNIVFHYTNSSSDLYFEKMELLWGTEQNSTAMIYGPIWSDLYIYYFGIYQEAMASFTPETNGSYVVGWHGISDANQDYIYIDDISIDWDYGLVAFASAIPDEICEGESSQLNGTAMGGSGDYTYEWQPITGLNNPNIANPIATPEVTTTYTVTVNDGDATVEDDVTVTVNPVPETPTIEQQGNVLVSSAEEGNQWYDSNGMINGATTQTFEPTYTENFYVVVTNGFDCESDPSNIIYFVYTGLIEIADVLKVNIYPNPFSDCFTFEYSLQSVSLVKISIYNSYGQLVTVLEDNTSKIVGDHRFNFDASSLMPGIYFCVLKTNERIQTKKMIKL